MFHVSVLFFRNSVQGCSIEIHVLLRVIRPAACITAAARSSRKGRFETKRLRHKASQLWPPVAPSRECIHCWQQRVVPEQAQVPLVLTLQGSNINTTIATSTMRMSSKQEGAICSKTVHFMAMVYMKCYWETLYVVSTFYTPTPLGPTSRVGEPQKFSDFFFVQNTFFSHLQHNFPQKNWSIGQFGQFFLPSKIFET
jgi:hypothetical protein